jgi:hypothetical protein
LKEADSGYFNTTAIYLKISRNITNIVGYYRRFSGRDSNGVLYRPSDRRLSAKLVVLIINWEYMLYRNDNFRVVELTVTI